MKENSQSFVKFLNLFRALNKTYSENEGSLGIHQEAVAILSFVSSENERGVYPTITKVVQKNDFGTPPTIQRRLKELLQLGLVEFIDGSDRRHRLLKLTAQGNAYLQKCCELMKEALGPCACNCSC
jgi:DNA-binding MarR family transcriptional regulator